MFTSINNSRNIIIQIAVFIFVVNIDTESHVVCTSCVCMVVCRGKKLLLIFQIVCTLVFMVFSFDGYTFNQATVQDSQTALQILLLSAM